jgi:hypothetical protein
MLLPVYLGIYLKGLSSVQSARRHHMDIRRPRGLPRLDGYPGNSNFWLSTNLVSLLRYFLSSIFSLYRYLRYVAIVLPLLFIPFSTKCPSECRYHPIPNFSSHRVSHSTFLQLMNSCATVLYPFLDIISGFPACHVLGH